MDMSVGKSFFQSIDRVGGVRVGALLLE